MSNSKDQIKGYNAEKLNYSPKLQDLIKIRDDQPPCPQPNATMFTTPTTPAAPTTTADPTTVADDTTTAGATDSSTSGASDAPSSTPPPPPKISDKKKRFSPSKVYVTKTKDMDPFSWYMKTLHVS